MESTSSSDHYNSCRWTRGRIIGRGSFATVHIANNSMNQTFAVKSTPLHSSNTTQLNSLNNEIQILQKLHNSGNSSPYVIKYLGNDTTSTRNLHLEYLPNGTVSEQSCKTEHVVRSYTRCLVAALAHLHSRNIVHCDVKGRNVLVGIKYGECKLADFGSAFEICQKSSTESVILPRGSPLWMAPEVLRGEYQGPESDVWSLGCTVIEMLTGKVNRGDGDTVWQMAFSDTTPEIPAGVSEECRDFMDKCLRRNLKERWSCEQLMNHPFVAEPLTWSNTPRCVLDEFESKFDGLEEMGSDSDCVSVSEKASMSSNSAIDKLCCGGEFEWEDDDGWLTVRMTECSDSVTEVGVNGRIGEIEGSYCNLRFIVSASASASASAWMGVESGRVSGGLLLLLLSFKMLLLIMNIFNTINGDLSLVWLFLDFCLSNILERRHLSLSG